MKVFFSERHACNITVLTDSPSLSQCSTAASPLERTAFLCPHLDAATKRIKLPVHLYIVLILRFYVLLSSPWPIDCFKNVDNRWCLRDDLFCSLTFRALAMSFTNVFIDLKELCLLEMGSLGGIR